MDIIREQLIAFLTTAQAHMTFSEAVKDFPEDKMNENPPNVEYSPWMLLEHIRITQKDLLDFMTDPAYQEPKWPDDYWPAKGTKADRAMWDKTITDYENDLAKFKAFVENPETDLTSKVEKGDGQTVIREILLAIDHTSHHIGEFAILRQVMGTWPAGRKE